MRHYIRFVCAGLRRFWHPGITPRTDRQTHLSVEVMEDRLALSATTLPIAAPHNCRGVHGYKWRRPPWCSWQVAINPQPPSAIPSRAVNLITGGSDGRVVQIGGSGPVVQPPHGPLPMLMLVRQP